MKPRLTERSERKSAGWLNVTLDMLEHVKGSIRTDKFCSPRGLHNLCPH